MPGKMESTNDAEAIQTDQQEAGNRQAEEAQGARPKQQPRAGPQPPAKKYQIHFLESMEPERVVRRSSCLEIIENSCLIFSGFFQATLEAQDVRIASPYQYDLGKDSIHLSFYNNDADCVSSLFFESQNEMEFQACLSELQEFLKFRLQCHCNLPETLEHAMTILRKQPVFIGWVRTAVHEKVGEDSGKTEAPPSDAPLCLVVVDLECVSWYLNTTVKPYQQLMFWAEETPKSIETVKHHHGQNYIQFESKTLSVIMEARLDIVRNMRILRPKKTNLMKDLSSFVAFVPQIQRDTPFYLRDEQAGTYNQQYWPAGAHDQQFGEYNMQEIAPSTSADWGAELKESHVSTLRGEMDSALDQFKDNEDFQNIWITQQFDLEELVKDGKVPQTDGSSGGLDANNEEHFKKALLDVTDYLSNGEFPTAMSRVVAVREMFRDSREPGIQYFLRDFKDMDILKGLYFRSLVK